MVHNQIKTKKAVLYHLTICSVIGAFAAVLVFFIWYPAPYGEISGGREMFALLLMVDIILGPAITLLIARGKKSSRAVFFDFFVIGVIQATALFYGVLTLFNARPVYLVFEYKNFAVVHAIDIDPELLKKSHSQYKNLPLLGPQLISLRRPESAGEQITTMITALQGISESEQPDLWQSYELAKSSIRKACKEISILKEKFPNYSSEIDQLITKEKIKPQDSCYLPTLSRGLVWTAIVEKSTALPKGYLPVDSF